MEPSLTAPFVARVSSKLAVLLEAAPLTDGLQLQSQRERGTHGERTGASPEGAVPSDVLLDAAATAEGAEDADCGML